MTDGAFQVRLIYWANGSDAPYRAFVSDEPSRATTREADDARRAEIVELEGEIAARQARLADLQGTTQ